MRVITGKAKACRLDTLNCYDVRPTTDKVKEAVFSTIQFFLEGRKFLDLFAGSGQIGIEALSRGSRSCTFVDKDIRAVEVIKNNLKKCKLYEYSNVLCRDIKNFLLKNSDIFDIIYLDPPYDDTKLLFSTLQDCIKNTTHSGSIVLCEHSSKVTLPGELDCFTKVKIYKYGKIIVSRYESLKKENT